MTATTQNLPAEALLKPGLHVGVSEELYFALPYTSRSVIEVHLKSSAHAREEVIHPFVPTKALDMGTAIHCKVLEQAEYPKRYVIPPKVDRRTRAGKDTWKAFEKKYPNHICFKYEDDEVCKGIYKSVCDHDLAREILFAKGARHEVAVIWDDPITDLRCKCRLDHLGVWDGWTVVADLKTTKNASPEGFPYEVGKYNLCFQAAFYLDGLTYAIGEHPRRFMWIAAEKVRPFAVSVFEPDLASIDSGRRDYKRCLKMHAECLKTDVWPGYGDTAINPITLPPWKMSEVTYDDNEDIELSTD